MPLLVPLAASKLHSRTDAAGSGCLRLRPGRRRGGVRPRADGGRAGRLPPARLQVGAVEGPPPARGWSRLLPRLPLPGSHLQGSRKQRRRFAFASVEAATAPSPSSRGQEAPRTPGEVDSSPLSPFRQTQTRSPGLGSAVRRPAAPPSPGSLCPTFPPRWRRRPALPCLAQGGMRPSPPAPRR